ncbi:unnamed protein product [Leuciscus chuanchicus]
METKEWRETEQKKHRIESRNKLTCNISPPGHGGDGPSGGQGEDGSSGDQGGAGIEEQFYHSAQEDTMSFKKCIDPCDRFIAGGDTHDRYPSMPHGLRAYCGREVELTKIFLKLTKEFGVVMETVLVFLFSLLVYVAASSDSAAQGKLLLFYHAADADAVSNRSPGLQEMKKLKQRTSLSPRTRRLLKQRTETYQYC